jgi:hypothetical protein
MLLKHKNFSAKEKYRNKILSFYELVKSNVVKQTIITVRL